MTMYNSKLAAAIKVAGKVLREDKENVYLPFNSEFSIFLKNLNTKRAVVKVEIDGKPIDDNLGAFVIDAHGTLELERFIRNGNLSEGNRFKFIQRNAAVEAGRGIGCEDGIVRIEWQYETLAPVFIPPKPYYNISFDSNWYGGRNTLLRGQSFNASSMGTFQPHTSKVDVSLNSVTVTSTNDAYQASAGVAAAAPAIEPLNANGITVEGSQSNQKFQGTFVRELEPEKFVMIFKLFGDLATGTPVKVAETKKTRKTCKTCKHRNTAGAKFCSECGTSLNII